MKQRIPQLWLVSLDFPSFKRQEVIFIGLNVVLLVALLAAQLVWSAYLGRPPLVMLIILGVGIGANVAELGWLQRRQLLSAAGIVSLTWIMITLNVVIAFALATTSHRPDIQYFALLIPPIFQAAFRLSLSATLLTAGLCDALLFFWVWNYFRAYPPADANEYLEAGTIALIYAAAALLVWTLVSQLRAKQQVLTQSMVELEKAEAQLLIEQKLAAVGRFSSAIAHEIRNPVAMISSALATASNRGLASAESQEMYEIATKEAARLERLTTDFLIYARPRLPSRVRDDVAHSVGYIGEICKPRAAERSVRIDCQCEPELWAEVDGGQLQQALLNLVMNAIEASVPETAVNLRADRSGNTIRIVVENSGGPIGADTVACIFEPFFTTKAGGTGLGLAIARNIILGHDGTLILTRNDSTMIQFTVCLPLDAEEKGSVA